MDDMASSDRDRLLAFELALDEEVCDEVRRESWGRLFLTPSTPLVWDANRVEIEAVGLSLERALAIADEALGGAGCGHRTIAILGEADGKRLGEAIESDPARRPRWEVERTRYMVWRGRRVKPAGGTATPPAMSPQPTGSSPAMSSQPTGSSPAMSSQKSPDSDENCERAGGREVQLAEIAGLRRALLRESIAAGGDAAVEQLFELDRRYGAAGGDRWFTAPAAGEPLSACRLLRRDAIGQVEEVGTLAPARGRGYAQATVLAAIGAAQAAADTTIFLTADAADWPQLFYARLGFEAVGDVVILRRRP